MVNLLFDRTAALQTSSSPPAHTIAKILLFPYTHITYLLFLFRHVFFIFFSLAIYQLPIEAPSLKPETSGTGWNIQLRMHFHSIVLKGDEKK